MKVPLALLADHANVTNDGKLNIMGIFQAIGAPSVPVIHPQMQIVLVFQTEPAERGIKKDIVLSLLDADGNSLFKIEQEVLFPKEMPLTADIPQIAQLNNLRFNSYGDYAFHIVVNGETKAQIPFKVVSPPQQPQKDQ